MEEFKKGIVKKITSNGEWKEFHKWMYEMENGDKGDCLTKADKPSHHEGEEIEYNIESQGKYSKIVFPKKGGGRRNDPEFEKWRNRLIVNQSSLKAAVDLVIADKIEIGQLHDSMKKFTKWVMED